MALNLCEVLQEKKWNSYFKASTHFDLNTFSQKFAVKYQDNISALENLAVTFLLLSLPYPN